MMTNCMHMTFFSFKTLHSPYNNTKGHDACLFVIITRQITLLSLEKMGAVGKAVPMYYTVSKSFNDSI